MSRITITIGTPDTLDTKDFVFEVDNALNMGFKHEFCMWTIEPTFLLSEVPNDEYFEVLKKALSWGNRKRGQWIVVEDMGDCCYRCSNCGFIRDAYILDIGNYCPNCGSRNEEIV